MTPTRRDFIGTAEVADAADAVARYAKVVVQRRRDHGLPTCGDDVPDVRKLSALMEEVGEVAACIQDGSSTWLLRDELLDVATAATLWAWALDQEST